MPLKNGALLISRQRLTLAEGLTPVNTGLRQVHLGLAPDPPLGGADPTADSAGVASRVQVTPLAPLEPWVTGNIRHTEPYFDATTGTIWVDFSVDVGGGEQTINVEFWDPHTVICPMDCDVYNTYSCQAPAFISSVPVPSANAPPITIGTPSNAPGQLVFMFVAAHIADEWTPLNIITADDAGWTVLRRANVDLGGGDGLQFAVFYRISAATDPLTYSFSFTSTVARGSVIMPIVFESFDALAPIQADDPPVTDDTPADPFILTAPSLTALSALPELITIYVVDGIFAFDGPPPDMTAVSDSAVGGAAPLVMLSARETILAAGPTGTKQVSTFGAGNGGIAYSLLIAPYCGLFPPVIEGMGIMDIMGIMGMD